MKRSAAAATMRVSKRRFGVQEVRPAVGRTALGGSASGAVADAADAIFADAKAFLDSPEAGQMNQSDLERELNRRRRELVGSLLQACRDQRNREQAAGPVDTGVESAERCEHDDGESISGGVQVGRPDDTRCGNGRRMPVATGSRAPPRRPSLRYSTASTARLFGRRRLCSVTGRARVGVPPDDAIRAAESGAGCSCSDRTCVRRRGRFRSILGCGMRSNGCGHVERCLPPPALLPPPSRRRMRRPMRPSPRPGPSPVRVKRGR